MLIPLQEASLRFDSSLLEEEASEMLGFNVDAKARFAVGGDHACVILDSGGARCWGAGSNGQLGGGALRAREVRVQQHAMGVEILNFAIASRVPWPSTPAHLKPTRVPLGCF
jgi:hypothetical protein